MRAAILRSGMFLTLAALGASAATAQTELFFATGVDSTGWAQAQSNADGHVLIESPQYPRGLWLHLVDEAEDALAGIRVEYQERPDSLVAIRCVDPAGGVRETLVWTRSEGDSLRLTLKSRGTADLPAGIASIDWQIDPSVESLMEPVEEIRLIGWEGLASFLRERGQDQAGRVAVQFDTSTLAIAVDHPEDIETLVAHLKQTHRPAGISFKEKTALYAQVFRGGFASLREGVILYLPLFADANLERVVWETLGRPQGRLTPEGIASLFRLEAIDKNIYSLAGLEHLTFLYWLHLRYNQIADVSPLAGLTNLQRLWLGDNQIVDVSPLANLPELYTLELDNNQIANVGPLTGLPSLIQLGLDNNQIADVSPLTGLPSLTQLSLDNNQIADATPLAELTRLDFLSLFSNALTDVGSLAGLNHLYFLDLSDNALTDVGPLAGLTRLEYLHLSDNALTDVGPLAGLTRLESLSLSSNALTDVGPLAELNNLRVLWLEDNQVADVTPLAGLTNLRQLEMRDNQISEVTSLAGLNNLFFLELDNNRIEDLAPLVANPGLGKGTRVFLTDNPLSDQALTEQIPALKARGVTVLY